MRHPYPEQDDLHDPVLYYPPPSLHRVLGQTYQTALRQVSQLILMFVVIFALVTFSQSTHKRMYAEQELNNRLKHCTLYTLKGTGHKMSNKSFIEGVK